ncbi:MAG: hypothetical protein JWN48_1032 [Myxococcaceae bacterium]|nr:hypothetical protein [Myxococcaceae bacterium]
MRRTLQVVALAVWCIALSLGSARADSLAQVFARGNAAAARGDYASAIREYEALYDAGIDDPDLAFNLGTSYGQTGAYGQAIRYFQRALRLRPTDSAARAGLRLARDSLGERQARQRGEAIVVDRPPLTEAVFSFSTESALALALLVSIWFGSALLIALSFVQVEGLRLGVGIGSAFCFALAVVSAIGVGAKADWGRDGTRAVVVHEGAAVREGPDDHARLVGELTEGESVRLLGREGRYARVLARQGEQAQREGYVLGSDVGEI